MRVAYRKIWWVAALLTTVLALWPLPEDAQTKAKPLTEPELVDLLKNFVPPGRVAELARDKGIDFVLTPQMEQELRQAGANDALINSLRELMPKPEPVIENYQPGPCE